jgi:hypothetical protein
VSGLATVTASVVIPLYNKGKYIERALSSVLSQTHAPSDIIVVDDGSTDDGPERVERIALSNPNITLIRQENRGPGAARNAGLAIAKGKYVAFLDADDEWLPSFLETGLAFFTSKESDIAVVWTEYYRSPNMERNTTLFGHLTSGVYEISAETDIKLVQRLTNFMWTGTAIVKTHTAKKWGGFHDKNKCLRGEDRHFWLKLLFNERIGIIAEPHAIYHTEASDLCGCYSGHTLELPPYIKDPDGLTFFCPPSKRLLFRQLLSQLALETASSLAYDFGQRSEAWDVLRRFFKEGYPTPRKFRIRIRLLAAFLTPRIRRLLRLPKRRHSNGVEMQ